MAVNKRRKALSHGRPPLIADQKRMSSQQSRTIIRTHHRLQKERAAALKHGNEKVAEEISQRIEANGGLDIYQAASKQGQSKERGGDSSKVLVEWLQELNTIASASKAGPTITKSPHASFRCLEVGALSTRNDISRFPAQIQITRIDLNSQEPGIEKQDFMERPLPKHSTEEFDIISLSLVLNYVPDAAQRGEMLNRVTRFMRGSSQPDGTGTSILPVLFLVLPLPCVSNSRYLDESLLLRIMTSLGFTLTAERKTAKLCYYLFSLNGKHTPTLFTKKKVRDGSSMNNFCIVLE